MEIDSTDYVSGVLIDQLNSDLNLIIDKECLLAYPISGDGFCSMWAGCRANYGVNKSKVAFEINLEDYCECPDVPKCSESEPHMIRVGWSLAESSNQLGENDYSFAYCNSGKKCSGGLFEDYGETFEKGDSVASYVDFETDPSRILISFSKNGIDMGLAFSIEKEELIQSHNREFPNKKLFNSQLVRTEEELKAHEASPKTPSIILFPHVLTKNIVFEMNFGQRVSLIGDEPFAPIKADYLLIQKVPIAKRFCSDLPEKDQPAEAIMLVGLPGVGKTAWANEHSKANPNKNFCIVGISSILDKMKNAGKKVVTNETSNGKVNEEKESDEAKASSETAISSKPTAAQVLATKTQIELIDKVLKCMNILIDVAAQSNRNVIIDQPNVYESTRRKKMKIFDKYKCRAVVLMPSFEAYNQILTKTEQSANESYMSLVNDMKANITLPKVGPLFETVEFIGLNDVDSQALVQFYHKEGVENRLASIVDKRVKKKLASKQNATARIPKGASPRFHNLAAFPGQQPIYPNEINNRTRFNPNFPASANNKRFMNNSYYNQPYRMNSNRFPTSIVSPMIPGYIRQPIFINNGMPPNFQNLAMPPAFNTIPQQPTPYNLNNSWPAATSTEVWNQQRVSPSASNWAPALPISNFSQQDQSKQQSVLMNMMPSGHRPTAVWPTNGNSSANLPIVDAWPAANQPN